MSDILYHLRNFSFRTGGGGKREWGVREGGREYVLYYYSGFNILLQQPPSPKE